MDKKKTKVNSFVRIKPKDNILKVINSTVEVINKNSKRFIFDFDKVFGPTSTTEEIFKEFVPYLEVNNENTTETRLTPLNITILAYGQTGSGKTFTISGNGNEFGLIQMILTYLIKNQDIKVSFIEVYNEKIYDAIDSKEKTLREVQEKFYIQDLTKKSIKSMTDFKEIWNTFISHRKMAETQMNIQSSRSHTISRIETDRIVINLVDLAGSEDNKKTGNTGERMKESQNINTSLFVLNKVVNAIIKNETRVPYRDSKLTRVLKESLREGKCFIIATVIDEIDEGGFTTNTLNFASKSRQILTVERPAIIQKVVAPSYLMKSRKVENLEINYKPKKGDDLKFSDKLTNFQTILKSQKLNTKAVQDTNDSIVVNDANINDVFVNKRGAVISLRKRNKSSDSSSLVSKGPLVSNQIEMTPVTKQKSKECFLSKALEYELAENYKMALDTYKTVNKISPSEDVENKIAQLLKIRKPVAIKISKASALRALNSGSFVEIKKLNGVGDKRAKIISDYVNGGNCFEDIDDLKILFSVKVSEKIREGIYDV